MRRVIDGDTLCVVDDSDSAILTIKVTEASGEVTLEVSGAITHDAAPEFEDELMSVLTSGHNVAVDFSGLEHISAPALDALLTVQRLVDDNRYKFYVKNISGAVKEVFEQTGFIDMIEIRGISA
jgi:anti-sigma B factor antagonist